MDEGGFSDYRANLWLNRLIKTAGGAQRIWIGLHYADPNVSGAYASEVFGGSYARLLASFSDADGRVVFNQSSILFRGMPSVRITHISGWDARYNGNMEFYIPLGTPVTVLAGKSFQIDASQLAISLP